MKRLVILLSVLLIAVTGPAFAQSTTGTIDVIVTDSSGAPLPGVTVTASASDSVARNPSSPRSHIIQPPPPNLPILRGPLLFHSRVAYQVTLDAVSTHSGLDISGSQATPLII